MSLLAILRRWGYAVPALAGLLLAPAPARGAPVVEYLYIDANEGGSSGGHVALRLGDHVFHFQHRPPGIAALKRDAYAHFRRHYADLENRTIHASRLPVSEETYALLVEHFSRQHVIQDQQIEALEALHRDRRALEGMLRETVSVEGGGFFFADHALVAGRIPGRDAIEDESAPLEAVTEPAIVALRRRIEADHGDGFIAQRLDEMRRRLGVLDPDTVELPTPVLSEKHIPPPTYSLPQRYSDAMAGLLALETLRSARPLRPGTTMADDAGRLPLGEDEGGAVGQLADALEASLARLAGSERPDWGPALLLGMGRLVALRHTQHSRRWVVLDAFPPDAALIDRERVTARRDIVTALLGDAGEELDRARSHLLGRWTPDAPFPEADFARLESALNRLFELRRGLEEGRDVRARAGRLVPTRPVVQSGVLLPLADEAIRRRHIARVEAQVAAYTAGLERLYGYNLITRNCVSEIFREIDAAFAQAAIAGNPAAEGPLGPSSTPVAPIRNQSSRRLGGHVTIAGAFNFIPAVSASAVTITYTVSDTVRTPSYRKWRLARMYQDENPLTVFLRESNTVTSTIYRRNPRDSFFLFFTDDTIAPRPLFGAANLLVGIGATAVGLLTLPVDRGGILLRGVRGALFSLPELFFQNIRKGSFEYVERADLPDVAAARLEAARPEAGTR